MANFTITLANGLSVFAGAPSAKWGSVTWNAFLWGSGSSDIQVSVTHTIAESFALSNALAKAVAKAIPETLIVSATNASIFLSDPAGYYYDFPEGTTDAETRVFPVWSSGTAASASWTVGTTTPTTWS